MKIGIDAGHGGIDPLTNKYVTEGKRSPNPVDGDVFYEGVNNRRFAKAWAKELGDQGHQVVYTVHPNDYRDISLTERVRNANKHNLDILISIHSNGARRKSAKGHEVFVSKKHDGAGMFASIWGEEFRWEFPEISYRYGDKKCDYKRANFTVLAGNKWVKPNYNGVLIELDFHTNDKAVRMMRTEDYLQRTIKVLTRAVHAYSVK